MDTENQIKTDPNELLKLDNQLCFAVYSCSREIIKLYHPHLEELGLTYTQYITMLVLWETPVISSKELGNRLHLDSGTLTPLLKKLEAMELIDRKRGTEDERSLIVTLTSKGIAMKQAAKEIPMKVACCVDMPAHEMVFLRESLKTLTESISNIK